MSTPLKSKAWLLCILLFSIQTANAFTTTNAHTVVKDSLIRIDSIVFTARFLRKNIIKKDFNQGDQIAISFHEASGLGISCIKIVSPSNYVDTIFDAPDKFDKVIFPIREQGTYTFQFINRKVALQWPLILRKNCRFVLWKVNWVRHLSDFVAYDTIRSDTFNFVKVIKDTAILPIIDQKVYLQPTRNLMRPPRTALEVILPKEVKKWGFWLGVGEAATRQYAQWEEGLTNENILSPLHAYLEGVVPKLPVNESGNTVNYHFTDYDGQTEFVSNGKIKYSFLTEERVKAAYGKQLINQDVEEGNEQKMFICLENNHPNSGINVDVKILASAVIFKRDTILTDSVKQITPRIFFAFEDTSKLAVEKELIAFQAGLDAARQKFLKDFRANPNRDSTIYRLQMAQFNHIQKLIDNLYYRYKIKTLYLGPSPDYVSALDIERIREIKGEARDIKDTTNTQSEPPFLVEKEVSGIDIPILIKDTLNILDTSLYNASGDYINSVFTDSLRKSIEFQKEDPDRLRAIIRELENIRLEDIQDEVEKLSDEVYGLIKQDSLIKQESNAIVLTEPDTITKIVKKINTNLSKLESLDNFLSKLYKGETTKAIEIIKKLSGRLNKLDSYLREYFDLPDFK